MITFQTPELLILSLLIIFAGYKVFQMKGLKRKIGGLNVLVALMLLIAVSGPELTFAQEDELRPSVTVIQDSSESSSLIQDWEAHSEHANLNVRTVNSDSDSFESQTEALVDPDEEYLFVSDLQFESDLPQYFAENNISMNLLTPEMDEDHAVRIEGPDQTVIGAENRFNVEVSSSIDESINVEAGIGNETLESGEPPLSLDLSFDDEEYQEIWAEIDANDEFSENNRYYKTVKVMDKPQIASIGQNSGLEDELEAFYQINSYEEIPLDLDDYEAVIMKQEEDSEHLRDFLVSGGGLMYTGNEYNMEYLPVESSDRPEETDAPLIIFALDISVGTDESGAAEAGKQIAYSLVDGLPNNARVGVVAYNRYAYDIIEPRLLATDRSEIQERISRLEPDGPTFHNFGLRAADSMINRNNGDGNVVMIADGKISALAERNNVERESQLEANTLSGRLVTVGVGDRFPREIQDEDREFLKDLAERTEGGFYVDGHSANDLQLTFDAGGGTDEMQPLVVSNSNHFITEGYSPNASLFEIDGVTPNAAANELVSTSNSEPVLTTGRYGLGRIAAYSADNRDLESLMEQDPSLVGRSLSWTTGPLDRDIWVEGSRIGEEFRVISRESIQGFSREADDEYIKTIEPENKGFHTEHNTSYSVNYRSSIERVGYNEEEFSRFTNEGNVYSEEDLDVFLEGQTQESAESQQSFDLSPYFVGLALLFYIGFIGLRKRNGMA